MGQGPVTMREATAVVPAASMTGHYSDVLPLGWPGGQLTGLSRVSWKAAKCPLTVGVPHARLDLAGLVRPLAQAGVPGR